MTCGLFGKLPAKRDFIAVNVPREFLLRWEEWMQGGVTASKLALNHDWLPAYLSAPLWRFWLGPEICGLPVAGVFMSSIDGVGRHFPLTVFDYADPADSLALPSEAGSGEWLHTLEDFLLSTLEHDAVYEDILARLEQLPMSARSPALAANSAVTNLFGARILQAENPESLPEAFFSVAAERDRLRQNNTSYWWTIGGEGFAPVAIVADGLPDANIMGNMLTGRFSATN